MRPCLVLGSAPKPRVSDVEGRDLICVNSSGAIARELGLPTPAVTILAGFKLVHPNREEDRQALRGLRTHTLLLIRHLLPWPLDEVERLFGSLDYRYEHLVTIDFDGKHQIIEAMTGRMFGDEDTPEQRVSNGVFAVCYALHRQAPNVLLSGISLTRNGHHYSTRGRLRHHIDADTSALIALRERGRPVTTTEPDVASLTGISLVGVNPPKEHDQWSPSGSSSATNRVRTSPTTS